MWGLVVEIDNAYGTVTVSAYDQERKVGEIEVPIRTYSEQYKAAPRVGQQVNITLAPPHQLPSGTVVDIAERKP